MFFFFSPRLIGHWIPPLQCYARRTRYQARIGGESVRGRRTGRRDIRAEVTAAAPVYYKYNVSGAPRVECVVLLLCMYTYGRRSHHHPHHRSDTLAITHENRPGTRGLNTIIIYYYTDIIRIYYNIIPSAFVYRYVCVCVCKFYVVSAEVWKPAV